jgi:predicted TIM-barrel fold metal-dependent hydrolase
MRTIALEEHFATTKFLNGPGSWHNSSPDLAKALADLGDGGLAHQHRHPCPAHHPRRRVRPAPNLQVIIGHMGEAIPSMVPRFDAKLKPELTGLNHPVSSYLRENLHYTFSNFNDGPTYANLIDKVGADRVAFSTDHPFGSMRAAREFLDNLPLSQQDRAGISHRNAEELLGL